MSKNIYQDLSAKDREKLLEANCVRKERASFTQALTDEEIQKIGGDFISGDFEIERMELQLKEESATWKKKIKEAKDKRDEQRKQLKFGRRETTGMLYDLPDMAGGKMNRYNKHGELIVTRDLTENERQGRAFIECEGGTTIPNPDDTQTEDVDHEVITDPEAATEAMYDGPQIAGMADKHAADAEAGEDSDPEGNGGSESAPQAEESAEPTNLEAAGAGNGESEMAWDDPRNVRSEEHIQAMAEQTEGGAKKRRGRPAKKADAPAGEPLPSSTESQAETEPEEVIPPELQGEEGPDEL